MNFFLKLSVTGDLLMIVHLGPGDLSVDYHRKKWIDSVDDNMKVFAVFSLLFITVNAVPFLDKLREPHVGKTWVVLAASSEGWINYGMEADVYHAYQVVRQHGIPDENIIVMHSDDIAHSSKNPTPGVVINRVGGKDVYKTPYEVPKHYIGKDVTPENFLGILKGDEKLEKGGKKVVKSGPNDRIFVYLDDHGGDEVVFFPTTTLLAKDLNNVLIDMHKENKFSQLVFYLAACEAGSMFAKLLPTDINVYALTATLPGELGWKAESDHTNLNTYLAVFFAVTWLDDSEHNDLTKELIATQYEYIKIHNNFTMDGSNYSQHAQQYGDLSIATKQHVSNYMGEKKVPVNSKHVPYKPSGMAPIRDSELYRLQHKIKITNDIDEKLQYVQQLQSLLNGRQLLDKQIAEYVNELPAIDANIALNGKLELNNRDCYKQLVNTFNDHCYVFSRNTYAINKLESSFISPVPFYNQ
ncbi:unnamed protein product [Oppiella nova]|uniref:Legumain n=1 Tax=Oppiella nova TaxID=334625 RepID=A0A7R9LU03_9ACAR|nr:unnamed protein product [Oppiella nova]CAG2166989.1 unnamed protein product [Oppiella nova]